MAVKNETVEAFIAEAEKELADVLRRKVELEDLIKKCKALFGVDPRQQTLPLEVPIHTQLSAKIKDNLLKSLRRERGKRIWEQIIDLLKEVERDLTISEIVHGFLEHNWPLSTNNGSKIIYRAMKDKPDIFIHTNRGTWDLKERFT